MPDEPEAIVRLEGVTKVYRMGDERVHALRGVDFEIKEGEYVAITGTSGSGKSTALQLMGILDVPTQGRLTIAGRRTDRLSDREQARLRGRAIGFVFQYFHLYPTLSALDNVALPMTIRGTAESVRRKRAKKLLQDIGLGDRLRHMPHQLSGGQRQRVAIARALANDPPLLLADEPTGNLDSTTSHEIMELLAALREQGHTLVIVTHDPDIARQADRVIRLTDGRVEVAP